MRRVVPKPEVLLFSRKRTLSVKQPHLSDCVQKGLHQPFWYLLTLCLILHKLLHILKLQKTEKRTLISLKQQMKELSKWNTL
jgi:hypothetical protein